MNACRGASQNGKVQTLQFARNILSAKAPVTGSERKEDELKGRHGNPLRGPLQTCRCQETDVANYV